MMPPISLSPDVHSPAAIGAEGRSLTLSFLEGIPTTFTYRPNYSDTASQHAVSLNVEGMQPGQRLEVEGMAIDHFAYDPSSKAGILEFGDEQKNMVRFVIKDMDDELGAAIEEDPEGYFSGITTAMPVCFLKGTKIRTATGECPVERLQVGDQVVGGNGLGTVKWLGWRATWVHSIAADDLPKHLPVRVCRGAIADSVPSRDICVSPGHHLLIDGLLVRAFDIINGKTIFQETFHRRFEYWHIELETFDVVSAHGIFSESWADGGNRDYFQNVDVTMLRASDMERRRAERPGFMALRQGAALQRIQVKLGKRAERLCVTQSQQKTRARHA